jgi:hypothetical protein
LTERLEISRDGSMSGTERTGGTFAMDKKATTLASNLMLLHFAGVM